MIKLIAKFKSLFRTEPIIGFCKVCNHASNCHGQNAYLDYECDQYIIELSCSGSGKIFGKQNICKCWKFEPLTNLEYLEMKYEEK
jgi:hypothetical protein